MVQAFIRKVLAAMIKLGLFLGVMICAEDTEEWRGRRGGGGGGIAPERPAMPSQHWAWHTGVTQ